MRYYQVLLASGSYHSGSPLTYFSEKPLDIMSVVTVPLRQRMVTGFIISEVDKPDFACKEVRTLVSSKALPMHLLELARWLSEYYACTLGESLKQFAPTKPTIRTSKTEEEPVLLSAPPIQLELEKKLTDSQVNALKEIRSNPSTTILLHGHTGSGKTRVYLELAAETIGKGRSVMILTPEIALTAQVAVAAKQFLHKQPFILHSRLSVSERKKIWLTILESSEPVVIIGPRSALFSPVHNLGLIVLDEAHEPAYKQDQSPRYHAARVASQLGLLSQAKVILGTATPTITDYYLAHERRAVVSMTSLAVSDHSHEVNCDIIDLKNKDNFSKNLHLSNQLITAINETLSAKKQVMIYLNRRGSARIVLCNSCGWQLLCPHCDVPLVYHRDDHTVRCHICGHKQTPPTACPECGNNDIIYKNIGTKALTEAVAKLFAGYKVQRFDSDNIAGEHVNDLYSQMHTGKIDILVGTQLLAKGLDLPKLGLVGIISAEASLALPDFTSEERTFQLLYQVIGRVGRGHGKGNVIVQSYEPGSVVVQSACQRDWVKFYEHALKDRQKFRFPPFSYLLQLSCRRATEAGAEKAAMHLRELLLAENLPVEVIGPAPSFYARRGKYYYWQIVVKSKSRDHLVQLAKVVPSDWMINLDPADLL